jgi:rhamnulokinase
VTVVIAVDFGAASIRVCRVDLDTRPVELDVVRRYSHAPVRDADGHLRWDWDRLVAEMEAGLEAATAPGDVASIGIDTWGVDYGLIDEEGALVAAPFSYRDRRTDGFSVVVDAIGERWLYATTGIQLQPFNTIFQLAAHDRAEIDVARHVLLLPELLVHHLTGAVTAERTSAGTTALVDVATGDWSSEMLDTIGIDRALLPPISAAGTLAGAWRDIPVHLVGGHDTASAVVAMGDAPVPSSAFVSAGTWLLVGAERDAVDTSERAQRENLTNEVGALGGVRFLKNLAGSWLIEGCRPSWGSPDVASLLEAASHVEPGPTFDVTDVRFLAPDDMLAEICRVTGLPPDADAAVVARCIVDSMAAGTARVIAVLGDVSDVYVFGGGSRNPLYVRRVAELTGLPVHPGPVEATALGNALTQGVAIGAFTDLTDARASLKGTT